jgi:hypothetical protein
MLNSTRQAILTMVLACLMFVALSACLNPIGEPSVDPDERQRWAIPLLQTQFSLEDALGGFDFEGTLLDQNGLRLVRRDTVFRRFPIRSINFPGLTAPFTDSVTVVNLQDLGVNLQVRQIEFIAGRLEWLFISNDPEDLEVELTLPNFTINGDTLVISATVPANGSREGFIDLENHFFDVGRSQQIFASYTARTPAGEPRLLVGGLLQIDPDFIPRTAIGSFDSLSVSLGSGSIITDFFAAFEPNTAALKDASVVFDVVNQTTVPFNLESVRTFASLRDGTEFDFGTPIDDGVSIARSPGFGQSTQTAVIIDDTNSGLVSAATMFPDSITLEFVGVANPERLQEEFTLDFQEEIIGSFVFDIPLQVQFDGFVIDQEFTFGDIEELDRVREAEIQLSSSNSFGLFASTQIFILNDSLQVIDSLFTAPRQLLTAGTLDANGEVVSATDALVSIPISDETFDRIRQFPNARARVFLKTPEGSEVFAQLDNTNSLALSVGLSFEYAAE